MEWWQVVAVSVGVSIAVTLVTVELRAFVAAWQIQRRMRTYSGEIVTALAEREAERQRAAQVSQAALDALQDTPATPVWPGDAVERLRKIWGDEPPTPEEMQEV